jgi:hypothetical protein
MISLMSIAAAGVGAVRTSNIVPRLNSGEPPARKTPALFSMIALAQ